LALGFELGFGLGLADGDGDRVGVVWVGDGAGGCDDPLLNSVL